jgi:ribose 5-phosphate isomerase B
MVQVSVKIALGADHAGWEAKERAKGFLQRLGYEVIDFGTFSTKAVDYPDIAFKVADYVGKEKDCMGILFCSTGIGMAIAANKVKGIRAAVCHSQQTAEMSRRHNDANILCIGANVIGWEIIECLLGLWLRTPFEAQRHLTRIKKIQDYELHNPDA